jgi:hypothetical protein
MKCRGEAVRAGCPRHDAPADEGSLKNKKRRIGESMAESMVEMLK